MDAPGTPDGLTGEEWGDVVRSVRRQADVLGRQTPLWVGLTPEDYFQEGIMAAIEQAKKYDRSTGFKAATYILPRTRGAMLDLIRESGDLVRVPSRQKGDRPIRTTLRGAAFSALHGEQGDDFTFNPNCGWIAHPGVCDPEPDLCPRTTFRLEVRRVFGHVGAVAEDVLVSYHFDGKTMRDIAAEHGLSESRISQMHSNAAIEMKRQMTCRNTAGELMGVA